MSVTPRAISLPFSFDVNGAVSYTEDPRKIVQDRIVIVVMTLLSERLMRPGFGTNVRAQVFENINGLTSAIEQDISIGFSKWLPSLNFLGVTLSTDSSDVTYVNVEYNYGTGTAADVVAIQTSLFDQSGNLLTEVPNGN